MHKIHKINNMQHKKIAERLPEVGHFLPQA